MTTTIGTSLSTALTAFLDRHGDINAVRRAYQRTTGRGFRAADALVAKIAAGFIPGDDAVTIIASPALPESANGTRVRVVGWQDRMVRADAGRVGWVWLRLGEFDLETSTHNAAS